jgi:hypothetical protein
MSSADVSPVTREHCGHLDLLREKIDGVTGE